MPEPIQALEYCFVCAMKLTMITGRVLLRPLKNTLTHTTIPLIDQRVTMCSLHADQAVRAGDYAIVDKGDRRITG